jgi:hypothetical protein
MFGTVGRLLGIHAETTLPLFELPLLKELLRGIPASLLVDPTKPQARLPVDIEFTR